MVAEWNSVNVVNHTPRLLPQDRRTCKAAVYMLFIYISMFAGQNVIVHAGNSPMDPIWKLLYKEDSV